MFNFPFMFKKAACFCIIAYVYSKPRSCRSQQQDRVSILGSFGSQSLTGDQVSQPVSSPTQFYVMTNQYRATDCQPVSQRPLTLCIISVNQGQTHVSFSVVAVLLHCCYVTVNQGALYRKSKIYVFKPLYSNIVWIFARHLVTLWICQENGY